MLIPVNAIASGTSELERVRRAVGANVQRNAYTARGRARAALRFFQLGMKTKEIAAELIVGESTVERDLAVMQNPHAQALLDGECIGYAQLASLMQAAKTKKADRTGDVCDAIESWAAAKAEEIKVEQARRRGKDEELLAGKKLKPAFYLKAQQISCWKEDLLQGRELGKSRFKFAAGVKTDDNGIAKLEIDGISETVAKMKYEDVVKVFTRINHLADELEPILLQKRIEQPKSEKRRGGKGAERLRELGIEDFDEESEVDSGEEATDFDATTTRDEDDLAGTAELPEDGE